MAGGVDVVEPAGRRDLYERVLVNGCAIAQAPCGMKPRRWSVIARARTVAALAAVTIVVEADEKPRDSARPPGRPRTGADGRRHPGSGHFAGEQGNERAARGRRAARARSSRCTRPAVWAGRLRAPGFVAADTIAPCSANDTRTSGRRHGHSRQLTRAGDDPGETMLALAELELMGLLARGDGGRYVPRENLAGAWSTGSRGV